jgi:hypothetical protein
MKKFNLIYNVCHWVGNNRPQFLMEHINRLKHIRHSTSKPQTNFDILCLFSIMVDDFKSFNKNPYIKLHEHSTQNLTIIVNFYPNWYGNVGSIELSLKQVIIPLNIKADFMCSFEDDCVINRDNWYDIFSMICTTQNMDLLGFIINEKISFEFLDPRVENPKKQILDYYSISENDLTKYDVIDNNSVLTLKLGTKKIKNVPLQKFIINSDPNLKPSEKYHKYEDMDWVDGGCYFFSLSKIIEMLSKVKTFVPKDINQVFDYFDYIELCEIGFPTEN